MGATTARNFSRRSTTLNMTAVEQEVDVKVEGEGKGFVVDGVQESALINDFLDLELTSGEK